MRKKQLMIDTVHHVPGRLRLRLGVIKRNAAAAAQACAILGSLPGVERVSANPVTGSVLIHYNPGVTAPARLGEELRLAGFAVPTATAPDPAERVVHAAVRLAIDILVERSAATLVAALI